MQCTRCLNLRSDSWKGTGMIKPKKKYYKPFKWEISKEEMQADGAEKVIEEIDKNELRMEQAMEYIIESAKEVGMEVAGTPIDMIFVAELLKRLKEK